MNGFQLFFCQESFLLRAIIAVSFWKARKEKTMFSEEEPVLKNPLFFVWKFIQNLFFCGEYGIIKEEDFPKKALRRVLLDDILNDGAFLQEKRKRGKKRQKQGVLPEKIHEGMWKE